MRVESGAPAHDLHFMGPDYALPAILGSRGMGGSNLTALSFLFFFNRAHRSHPMPHQLEGFQLASRARFNPKPLVWVMLLAVLVGSIGSFWAYLHDVYRFGSSGSFAHHPFNRLQQQLNFPTNTNIPEVTFMGHRNGVHLSVDVFTDAVLFGGPSMLSVMLYPGQRIGV